MQPVCKVVRECRVTLIICGCGKIVYMSHVEFHIIMREIL